ncbi:purine and uridine phosphorylase [Aspergillus varians]
MESAAHAIAAILVTLLLGLGLTIVCSGGRWKRLSPPVTPPASTRKRSPKKDADRTSAPPSSPLPPRTVPPVAEQNLSPFDQSSASAPQQAVLPSKKSTDYTVGWICAIVTEYAAAQEFLDEEHEAPDFVSPGDTNDYTLGKIGKHNVVIAVLPDGEYGTAPAAMVATNMQNSFPNVRIGLLVGIGGGVPSERHDIRLGDVVVSAPRDGKGGVFQYDFGKTMQGRSFQHTRFLNQPPPALRTTLTGLQAQYKRKGHQIESTINSILNRNPRLQQEYGRPPASTDTLFRAEVTHNPKGCADFCARHTSNMIKRRARTSTEQNPSIHYGLIASANKVMKDALVRDQLAAENDILCFEMEAAGLMNQFPCLVIRGICDYSDSHKNKEWQGFAAMTAAAYANDILRRIPPNLVEAEKKISEILSGLHDIAKENQDLAKQSLETAKGQLNAQKDFAKERLSDKEEKCHQLFRLTSGSGGDATYEWYKNRVEDRVDNTCMWFLQHENFQKWLQNESGPLLVSADPGCGKSVLARYLIDSYLPRSATICYFFFKDQVQDRVWQMLCALLHQLFSQKPSLIKHAMPEYSNNGEGLISSTESLWKVLRNAVEDPQSGPIIMVLDALDECSGSEFPDLMRNVESQFRGDRLGQGKLRYLLTCRPYESIVSRFSSLYRTFSNIRIPGEEESETISYEVNHVITHRVNQLSQKKNLSSEVKRHLEHRLRKTTHRTYLWVYLVFNYLEEEQFKKTVKGVEAMLTTIPKTVNEAYEHILNKSKEHLMVRKALSIILAASRPLTLAEMNIAMSVDDKSQSFEDLDLEGEKDFKSRLRTLCGLFISIHQGRIHFLHQTAREFLLEDLRSSTTVPLEPGWHHSIAMTQTHEVLATVCVLYLNFFNSNITISTNADEDDSNFAGSHDFLDYSAKNWTTHFREASIIANAAILPSTLRICDPNSSSYAAWFGIFWKTTSLLDTKHFTDLMLASYCGHCATTKLLLKSGKVDMDSRDSLYGRTPLLWAAMNGHEAVDTRTYPW